MEYAPTTGHEAAAARLVAKREEPASCACCGEAIISELCVGCIKDGVPDPTSPDEKREEPAIPAKSKLDAAIQNAARDLPEGWSILLQVEKGAGWVELFNDDGAKIPVELDDLDLHESVAKCVERALLSASPAPAFAVTSGQIDLTGHAPDCELQGATAPICTATAMDPNRKILFRCTCGKAEGSK